VRGILIAVGLLICFPAYCFYEWQGPDSYADLRGLIRGFGSAYEYPDDALIYPDSSVTGLAGLARLMSLGRIGDHTGFEFNIYQSYIPSDLVLGSIAGGAPLDTERSATLDWSFSDDDYTHLAIDRLSMRWSAGRFDARVGRQPVNLATTFYFTPNDFFAPYAAQAFFRVYKPGVDAARAELRLNELSTVSLISVLGYEPDPASDTGWSGSPDRDRASYVGRASTVLRDVEVALLLGRVRRNDVLGASLQGEWFDWLGVRAEGHVADPRDSGGRSTELSVGLEHRWENSLELRVEYFHHGSGADDVDAYQLATLSDAGGYLAKRYLAVGTAYEFGPLFNAQAVMLNNLVDNSWLLTLYGVYSLSDEAELAVNVGLPGGDRPEGLQPESEFGLFPRSATIEIRSYF